MNHDAIHDAVRAMGPGPLTEEGLRAHIFPLFSRVLTRDEIYLANHSLGRPLDGMADDVREALDAWYRDMDDAWGLWLDLIREFRAGVAKLIGLSRADAVVPKTSAGQGLRAVLNALQGAQPRVLATRGEFDSIDFILKVYHQRRRAGVSWIEPDAEGLFTADSITRAIQAASPAPNLVVISPIFYATGQYLPDVGRAITAAHARGSLVMLDLYHTAGVVPIEFEQLGADFAIGGSYKYLRGGPGACWLAIHPRHLSPLPEGGSPSQPLPEGGAGGGFSTAPIATSSSFASFSSHSSRGAGVPPATIFSTSSLLPTLDTGWFAKKDTFLYQRPEAPEFKPGGDAWLESTPPVLPIAQALAGLTLTNAIGVDRLRTYNLEQQRFLIEQLRHHRVPVREIEPRGAFVLIPHADAMGLCATLKSRGVNTDARGSHVRLCPDMLNTQDELSGAARTLGEVWGHL